MATLRDLSFVSLLLVLSLVGLGARLHTVETRTPASIGASVDPRASEKDRSVLGSIVDRLNAVDLNAHSSPSVAKEPAKGTHVSAFVFFSLLFLGLIASEVVVGRRRGVKVYRFSDTISHLTIFFGQQVVNFSAVGILASIYDWIQARFGMLTFDRTRPLHWLAVVLMADLVYYASHRLGHRVNLFIIPHSVHHQAHDFNHVSSFRLPWINRVILFTFYSVLAFIGVPTEMLVGAMLLHLLVGFFAHSGVIRRRLGWLEYVIVTPRSHFAHHGTNAEYLDRNFGGIFIFWDRLFGTFAEYRPKEAVILPPETTLDPLEANLDYFRKTRFALSRQPDWRKKVALLFGSPEVLEAELARLEYRETSAYRVPLSRRTRTLVIFLLAGTAAASIFLLMRGPSFGWPARAICAAVVFSLSLAIGNRLRRRDAVPPVDRRRAA